MTARLVGGRWECPSDPLSEQLLNGIQQHEAGGPLAEGHAITAIKFFDKLGSPPPRRRGRILRVDGHGIVPGRVY